jgi:CheY-like chemotaxis protein
MSRRIRALIVEDSGVTRKAIMRSLNETGLAEFSYTEAADGFEALERFDPVNMDMLFVDMHMPRMGGIEFLTRLRQTYAQVPPAVMITAETNQDRLLRAVNEAGVAAVLIKPLKSDRMAAGLKTLIDGIPDPNNEGRVPHGDCAPTAMQEIIEQVCGIKLTRRLLPSGGATQGEDIILALISILGGVNWSTVFGFDARAAEGVASKLLDAPIAFDDPDIGDAIGEVANFIVGDLKRKLSSRGVPVQFSLPSVVSARGLRFLIQQHQSTATIETHFRSEIGHMWVRVSVGVGGGLIL